MPEYFSKCQIMLEMGWTEKQYAEENSIHFLEAELGVYLEAKSKAAEIRNKKKR